MEALLKMPRQEDIRQSERTLIAARTGKGWLASGPTAVSQAFRVRLQRSSRHRSLPADCCPVLERAHDSPILRPRHTPGWVTHDLLGRVPESHRAGEGHALLLAADRISAVVQRTEGP